MSEVISVIEGFDLVEAYVPSNPFHAMANAVVPAVVAIVAGSSWRLERPRGRGT